MHQSHCPTSVPLQHPVLVLGPVENDNPVTERLKEALDAIEVLQQQVQGLTRRLEDHILDQKKDDFSSNLVFSSIESMKEENDANHRFLEIQISAASKDRTKLRVELEKHTATHIAGARNALQEGHKSYTSVRDKIAALHDRVNSTVNDMNSRTALEVKAFEARLQTSMDAQQKLLTKQTDSSLADMETRITNKQKELTDDMGTRISYLRQDYGSIIGLKTELNRTTNKSEDKLKNLNSMILDNTKRLNEINRIEWQEYQIRQEEQDP